MSATVLDSQHIALTIILEALELRVAQAHALVIEARSAAAAGNRLRAVSTLTPIMHTLPQAVALVDAALVLHRSSCP